MLEPWIKHAMGENEIRNTRGSKVLPSRHARPLPKSMRYKVAIRLVHFLRVVCYDGLDTMFAKAFVQSNNGLNDPTGPKVFGVGKVNDLSQDIKTQVLVTHPGLSSLQVVVTIFRRKINPTLLIVTINIGIVLKASPKPAKLLVVHPKILSRYACYINPA